MSKFLSFEEEAQWKASDDYDDRFEYFRGGEDGCMWLYKDEKTGRCYWYEDHQFNSAPLKKYGSPDLEQRELIRHWENMDYFTEDSSNFEHLIMILEKLVLQNMLLNPWEN